jgi:hypothetical protein
VVVRDGLDVTSTVIAQFCNSLRDAQVFSTGRFLYVDFIVDGSGQRQGFEATYQFKSIADDIDRPYRQLGVNQRPIDPRPIQVNVDPSGSEPDTTYVFPGQIFNRAHCDPIKIRKARQKLSMKLI